MDIKTGRHFLRHPGFADFPPEGADQQRGVTPPPREKPAPEGATLIDLAAPEQFAVGQVPLIDAIRNRRSRRQYTDQPLTLEELSFLLWATQGVREVDPRGVWTRRTVPSGGARHAFETYLFVNRVEGLAPGLYRYLPIEHKLCFLYADEALPDKVGEAAMGQAFVGKGAVTFIWSVIPYRAEWRYATVAHKAILLDAGHLCQNLYLACEAIGAGTCAIAAYNQEMLDAVLGVDGEEEMAVYLAPVGKVGGEE